MSSTLLRLRPVEQLLEAGGVFEALFEGFRAFGGIGRGRLAVEPGALLLLMQELSKAFCARAIVAPFFDIKSRSH